MDLKTLFNTKRRVLIVDDVKSARKIVGRLLQNMGINDIDFADNGIQAMDVVKEKNTALIISDWDMPQMNGIQLLKTLRQDKTTESIPFLMITSSNDKESVFEAVQSGVSEYIVKPFNEHLLHEKIDRLVKKFFENRVIGQPDDTAEGIADKP